MEKDIDRIPKNADTDIVIRIDDFGGRRGVTIREFVRGERYTGFTKAGTRIPVEHFKSFKEAINSINEKDLMEGIEELTKAANSGNMTLKENNDSKAKGKSPKPVSSNSGTEDIGEEEF